MIKETVNINPYYLSVISFDDENKLNARNEKGLILEYKEKDLYTIDKILFYSLLRQLKLPIAEYRKFECDDKKRLLNIYFKTLASSEEWEIDISKTQNTFRVKAGKGFECSIYSVFTIRKVKPVKETKDKKKAKGKNTQQRIYNSEQERIVDENQLIISIGLVVMAFFLYFLFRMLGGL